VIIDAHQHVWDLETAVYDWFSPGEEAIHRTIRFEELEPELRREGIDRAVMVQSADNDEDTDHMFRVADQHPEVAGIVVYLPLSTPARAADRLAHLKRDPRTVGVRTLIHNQPDPNWILRPDVADGLRELEQSDVPFDYVAVLPEHLRNIPAVCERHPNLRIVIDHLGKPPIGGSSRWAPGEWEALMRLAAVSPNVYAKVSGLYAAAGDPAGWSPRSMQPFVDHAVNLFTPSRLMYGSDWPVSLLAGGYARVLGGLRDVLSGLDAHEQADVFGGTAQRFYRISAETGSEA